MDEQYVPYDYLKMTGQPTGTIYGLVATGFLTAKDIADGYPVMNGFNNIQAGDVKYKDMNGDGEINEFDRTVIGGDKPPKVLTTATYIIATARCSKGSK